MTETDQKVQKIKQSFRQMMDGQVAQSMRQKGVDYHLNWGATLPRLREMAEEIKAHPLPQPKEGERSSNYSLAIALWKENVRECKILATMLMPPDELLPEVADIWMEQTPTIEIAEQAAFNLYQLMPQAAEKAFQWIAGDNDMAQLCGFHILSRLFMRGQEPDEREINELIDQSLVALRSPNTSVRKAALNCMNRFSQLALVYERLTRSAFRIAGIDYIT